MWNQEPTSPDQSAPHVLLAEDDTDLRLLFASRLRAAGIEVTEAKDGGELLETLLTENEGDERRFDLVVTDLRMPQFSALDVMVAARARLTDRPILIVTAFGSDEHTRTLAKGLGATAVLHKPVNLEHLVSTVQNLLRESPPSHSASLPSHSAVKTPRH